MRTALKLMSRGWNRGLRLVRWTLATVEDDEERRTVPKPGPAHGPVRAIDVRLEEHRKAS